MKKDTERQLNEAYNHMLNYFKDEECTEELREMCRTVKHTAEQSMTMQNVKAECALIFI